MRKRFRGLNGTLFLFSLTVTAVLILAFILYIKFMPIPQTNLPNYLTDLDFNLITSLGNDSTEIPISAISSIFSKEQITALYLSSMIENLPYLLLFIVGFVVISSIVFSKILQNQKEAQAALLAKQLSWIDDSGEIAFEHPAIEKAYSDIKNRLDVNALDYIRLSSYVTHEQKNMLSLMRAKLQLSGNEELIYDVDKVVDSLDDILTLSAAAKSSEMEIIDVALICADVCDEYQKIYPKIIFDFDEIANNHIVGRELWINRALSNLINNAMKHSDGEIKVSVSNQNGSVIISVSDEGNGIDEDELDKLFDFRHRIEQLKKDGYGIGLSLVRHVCDICGGLCLAENCQTKGTIFYMVFPESLTIN